MNLNKNRRIRQKKEEQPTIRPDSPLVTNSIQQLQKPSQASAVIFIGRCILVFLVFISVTRVLFCPVHLSPGELKFIQWAFVAVAAQLGLELSRWHHKKG